MVLVTALYLNGDQIRLQNCETVGGIMVKVAVLHDRFAPDVAVFSPDTYNDLTNAPSQVPPSKVFVVLKQETGPFAEEDLKLALKLHAEQEDTATCVRALKVMRQSYPQACPGDILLDVVKDGAETQLTLLRTLLRAGIDGTATLHSCAARNKGDALQALLSAGVDPDNKDVFGTTALLVACTKGHNKIVEMLLRNGADVNHGDKYGGTALMYASLTCAKTVEMLLCSGADANYVDKDGRTPLHLAILSDVCKAHRFRGHGKIVEVLLSYGAYVNHSAKDGDSALTLASNCGWNKTVEMLLSYGAVINHSNNHGATPLMQASQKGHQEIVEILLRNGADVNRVDKNGDTAFTRASAHNGDKIVTVLSNWVNVNQVSTAGGSARAQNFDASHGMIVDVLLSNSEETHVDKTSGTSAALTRVSETGDSKTVELELPYGGAGRHADENMNTSLTRAPMRQQKKRPEAFYHPLA